MFHDGAEAEPPESTERQPCNARPVESRPGDAAPAHDPSAPAMWARGQRRRGPCTELLAPLDAALLAIPAADGLDDVSLIPLAEIVHDIDLKDGKFGRPETGGIASLVAGIAMGHAEDESRLARASAVFDDLREYFRRKPNTTRRGTMARDGKEPT